MKNVLGEPESPEDVPATCAPFLPEDVATEDPLIDGLCKAPMGFFGLRSLTSSLLRPMSRWTGGCLETRHAAAVELKLMPDVIGNGSV